MVKPSLVLAILQALLVPTITALTYDGPLSLADTSGAGLKLGRVDDTDAASVSANVIKARAVQKASSVVTSQGASKATATSKASATTKPNYAIEKRFINYMNVLRAPRAGQTSLASELLRANGSLVLMDAALAKHGFKGLDWAKAFALVPMRRTGGLRKMYDLYQSDFNPKATSKRSIEARDDLESTEYGPASSGTYIVSAPPEMAGEPLVFNGTLRNVFFDGLSTQASRTNTVPVTYSWLSPGNRRSYKIAFSLRKNNATQATMFFEGTVTDQVDGKVKTFKGQASPIQTGADQSYTPTFANGTATGGGQSGGSSAVVVGVSVGVPLVVLSGFGVGYAIKKKRETDRLKAELTTVNRRIQRRDTEIRTAPPARRVTLQRENAVDLRRRTTIRERSNAIVESDKEVRKAVGDIRINAATVELARSNKVARTETLTSLQRTFSTITGPKLKALLSPDFLKKFKETANKDMTDAYKTLATGKTREQLKTIQKEMTGFKYSSVYGTGAKPSQMFEGLNEAAQASIKSEYVQSEISTRLQAEPLIRGLLSGNVITQDDVTDVAKRAADDLYHYHLSKLGNRCFADAIFSEAAAILTKESTSLGQEFAATQDEIGPLKEASDSAKADYEKAKEEQSEHTKEDLDNLKQKSDDAEKALQEKQAQLNEITTDREANKEDAERIGTDHSRNNTERDKPLEIVS